MTALPRAVPALLASQHPAVAGLVSAAGRVRDRLDHPQLRDARRVLRAFRGEPPDVVLLGESVLDFVGPRDADRRRLPTMLADELGPERRVLAVHGGGYHAELLTEFVRLVGAQPRRPQLVVVALWVRGRFRPWIEHPRFGHADALQRLRRLGPGTTPLQLHGSLRRASSADFEAFYRLPHPTLLGDLTVGDYARPLKEQRLPPQERLRLLYAYHHGARLVEGSDDVAAVTALGAAVRDLGCAVLAYETPFSTRTGERVLGPQFRELAEHNLAVVRAAFRAGAGEQARVLRTGTCFDEEEFIDPADGSEHLAERGRRRLAALLAREAEPLLR